MKLGTIFPQTEIGADPGAVREYIQAVDGMGFSHMILYDHVLGADAKAHQGWSGSYNSDDMFHEPMVLFGYAAGITSTLELVSGVLVLGQRQTALVAKQAAEVDILTGGRLRLGIGIGWNYVEYEALDSNFRNRGKRSEEQIALMRQLWTQEIVNFEGRWHRVTHAGLNPLPVQRPIPVWLGGRAEDLVQRVARIGDGWFPNFPPDDEGRATIARLHNYAREAGRDPKEIGIEARVNVARTGPEDWMEQAKAWEDIGASHLSVNTMNAGFTTAKEHIDAVERFKKVMAG